MLGRAQEEMRKKQDWRRRSDAPEPYQPARRRTLQALADGAAWMAMGTSPSADAAAFTVANRPIPPERELLPGGRPGYLPELRRRQQRGEGESLKEVLRLFVQNGGALVDSSPMYGSSESVVGDLAAGLGITSRLFMATKVWTSGREAGIRADGTNRCERMKVTRMDLMQIHNPAGLAHAPENVAGVEGVGRIRYMGITRLPFPAHTAISSAS